ncbi:histone deacetylase [Candidatus Geothermarchaeota archaeon ex4572_27]|nr:MAG: histone deacetylase [Candidatus Geothermarchaeota archaeon ex4572_27]
MKIVYSEKCLGYGSPYHPESPMRVKLAYEYLKDRYEFIDAKPASESDLLLVHDPSYIERIKLRSFYDPDTPAYENIYEYARLSAGGAIVAAKELAFSLMRPPGHHAGRRGLALGAPTLGFCYFNNIAIAVKKLGKKTIIVDIDTHHGNGTQEIFQGSEDVVYISLHTRGIYPGTGYRSVGNCYNYPLPPGTDDRLYLKTLRKALEAVDPSRFELVAVSAGFDTLEGDLGGMRLTVKCYREIGRLIASLGLPVFAVLEGGYTSKLGECIDNFIQGLEEGG